MPSKITAGLLGLALAALAGCDGGAPCPPGVEECAPAPERLRLSHGAIVTGAARAVDDTHTVDAILSASHVASRVDGLRLVGHLSD